MLLTYSGYLLDDDDWGRRRGGYVRTSNKHKSHFNMGHSHEHSRESVRRFKREYPEDKDWEGPEDDK